VQRSHALERLHLRGGKIAYANGANAAFFVKRKQHLGGALHRNRCIGPVNLVQVNLFGAQPPRYAQYLEAVAKLDAFAREYYGKRVLELAARWVLDRPGVSAALWGAKRPEQLNAVDGIFGSKLDDAAMAALDAIVRETVTDPVGPEYLTPAVRS
jgi:hypothetical protein